METKATPKTTFQSIQYQHPSKKSGTMEVKKGQRGYLLIHHQNENDLDDCMDATAGLISLADQPTVPTTLAIF